MLALDHEVPQHSELPRPTFTGTPKFASAGQLLGQSRAESGGATIPYRAHHRQHQVGHRRVLAREDQALLEKRTPHPAPGQPLHQPAQVVEVPRQAVHAVHHHRVALAHVRLHRVQFEPLGVLARGLVDEELAGPERFDLTVRVLLEAADSDVADAMTLHGAALSRLCQGKL